MIAAACGDDSDDSSTGSGGTDNGDEVEVKKIGIALDVLNEYITCLVTGVLEEYEGQDIEVIARSASLDPQKQVSIFEDFISEGVDGILVYPVTAEAAARGALAADEAEIPSVPVFWHTESAADEIYPARVRIDNELGGQMMVDWVEENAEPGEVVTVEGFPGEPFNEGLKASLHAGLESLSAPWDFVGEEAGNYLRADAITAAQNLLEAHPDTNVIIDYAAEMGNGIASLLAREGRDDVVHVTSDANHEMIDWMDKGYITAVRYFSPAEEGRLGAAALVDYLKTGNEADFLDVQMSMETADTIHQTIEERPFCYDEHLSEAKQIIN